VRSMPDTEFKSGQLIDNRYRVQSFVGSGGLGTVYCVRDEAREDQRLALKIIQLDRPVEESPKRDDARTGIQNQRSGAA
jgi:serine/threonine protein kinase